MSWKDKPWDLWKRQVVGILRLELKKNFFSKRAFPLYFLAGMPTLLLAMRAILPLSEREIGSIGDAGVAYAALIFMGYTLRLAIFVGCVFIFTSLFRGEVLERSLHYLFLVPVRRDVLVVGKYISGQIATATIFMGGVLVSFVLMYLPHGSQGADFFTNGPGFGHLLAYLGVTLLACLGYGAVFLLMGLLFKNPIIPALAIYGWESINFFLPATLKKFSVIHYLDSLCPVPIPAGPVKILADPAPAWLSVPGLLVVTALVLVFAGWKIRRMEITYSGE